MRSLTMALAMNEALREEMRRDQSVYVVGLGLYPSTADGITAGLVDEFDELRVRSAPMSETVVESVHKTGRLVVVDEDTERCGVGAEIGAQVMERAFGALRAPVGRVANPNLPVPYSPPLEKAVLPSVATIEAAILATLAG